MANTAPDRKSWDDETKARWAKKILDGEITIEQARKELEVQPYQLLAWVGQQSLLNRGSNNASPSTPADMRRLITEGMANHPQSDSEKAIVEWYIRKYIIGISS